MESMYAEVVVKPKQPLIRNCIAYLVYVLDIAFFLLACYESFVYRTGINIMGSLPVVIVVFALNTYFYRKGKIEYEYLYCDDVMIIAKITNKSKRKNIAKIETDNIEIFAPENASELNSYKELPKRDFASVKRANPVYTIVTVFKGKKVRILIEPSDKLLYCFRMKLGTRYVGPKTIIE